MVSATGLTISPSQRPQDGDEGAEEGQHHQSDADRRALGPLLVLARGALRVLLQAPGFDAFGSSPVVMHSAAPDRKGPRHDVQERRRPVSDTGTSTLAQGKR